MKVLFHFMHNPWLPRSGAHRRCLWMLQNFVNAGADVVFVSSATHTEQPWSENAGQFLKKMGVRKVCVYQPGLRAKFINKWAPRAFLRTQRNELYTEQQCDVSYRLWFKRLVDRESPDLLVMNYAWFDQLMRHSCWSGMRRVMETHDFLLINRSYRNRCHELLAARASGAPPEEVYFLDLMGQIPLPNLDSEIQIYDQYNLTISISAAEDAILKSRLTRSEVGYIPIGEAPREMKNEYREGILLAMGPNPFNQLALGFFCEQVWPLAKRLNPNIKAYITGSVEPPCPIPGGIQHLGFVSNLDPLFQSAKFAVSPVFIGTGQQVKIVEYLACGLGVVALDVSTVSSLLKHEKNGLITKNAAEMAEAIAGLYGDPKRCRNYGETARETIRQDYNDSTHFKSAFYSK